MARKRLPKLIQERHPATDRWKLYDARTGTCLGAKKSPGPYQGYPMRGEPLTPPVENPAAWDATGTGEETAE